MGTAAPHALLRATSRVVGLLLGSIMVGGLMTSLVYRWQTPVVNSVYEDVFTVLRERQTPGELILVAMPPVAWLSLPGQRGEIRFLAGSAGRERSDRYTFPDGNVRRDFWLGVESVTSVRQLCEHLSANPGSWVAIDQGRLVSRSVYGGDMNTVLRNATAIHRLGRGGVRLSRVRPEHAWAGAARSACDRHRGRAVVAPSGWGQTIDP
jgi:hypothetical protein